MAILTVVAGYAGLRAWGIRSVDAKAEPRAYTRPAAVEPALTALATVPSYTEASISVGPEIQQFGPLKIKLEPAVSTEGLRLVVRNAHTGVALATQALELGSSEMNIAALPCGTHRLQLIHRESAGRHSYLTETEISITEGGSQALINPGMQAFAVNLRLAKTGGDRRPVLPILRRRDDPAWRFCQACSATPLPVEDAQTVKGTETTFSLPIGTLGQGRYTLSFDGFIADEGLLEFTIPGPSTADIAGKFTDR